jgi:hypothetical protein
MWVDSNVQLAMAAAKAISSAGAANGGKATRVHIVLPDVGEYSRSYRM